MTPETCRIPATEGLTLTADVWGDLADPTIVMLHGAGQNRHAWKGSAARLVGAGWSVVTVDGRGHGDSDWSAESHYDMDYLGRDVHAVIEYVRTEAGRADGRAPAVVGASMGGMAALSAQRLSDTQHPDNPQCFGAVVLVDITPNFDVGGARRIVQFMTDRPDGFADLDEAADAIAAYNPHRPRPADSSGLARVLRQRADGRWIWRWDPNYILSRAGLDGSDETLLAEHMARTRTSMYEGAHAVDVPLLLVRGSQSDLVTPETVQEFLDEVPAAEFVDVAGTGHMVAGDDNDAFTAAVAEFLGRVYPPN